MLNNNVIILRFGRGEDIMIQNKTLLAITEILVNVIHQHETIEYGQVSKLLSSRYHINIPADQLKKPLDYINRVSHKLGFPHLSVVVTSKGDKLPGAGFYKLMRELNPKYDTEIDDLEIWALESKAVYNQEEWGLLLNQFKDSTELGDNLDNQTSDKRNLIYQYIQELINKMGFISDQSHKNFIRFSTRRLDNIVGFSGEDWTNSCRILLFQIESRESSYTLKLLIGPGNPHIRQILYNIAKEHLQIYNKGQVNLTDTWITIYSNKFLNKDEIAKLDIDNIESVIQQKLQLFTEKDLPRLYEVLERNLDCQVLSNTPWIIPCNIKYYDVKGAFNKFQVIEWKQTVNVQKGDIVYIYIGRPIQQIKYKCVAIDVDLKKATIDDREFVLDGSNYENYGRYMQLKLIEEYEDGMFNLEQLKSNGLSSVQSPTKIDKQLETYIKGKLELAEVENNAKQIRNIDETEKLTLVKSRIGHGILKKRLLQTGAKCKICGLADEHFLIASHIKPWSISDNEERLDLDNVFLLCPQHDAAFDKGYITFNEEGEMLVSNELSGETKALLNLKEGQQITLSNGNVKYIEWHRKNIFI